MKPLRIHIRESVTAGDLGDDPPASLLREGQAMLAAISADCRRIPSVEVTTNGDIATGFDWTLIIAPESGDLLLNQSQAVLDAGGRLLGSSPDAIRLTGDKLATASHWASTGVPHPRTEFFDPDRRAPIDAPFVMKPRHGAGSQATFLIRNSLDLLNAWSPAFHECDGDEFIAQRYVPGQPASVALLISPWQTIPLMPARQHLSQDGRFRYLGGSLPLPETLQRRAVDLALSAVRGINGLHGYVGVDLMLGNDGHDYAIEINPRLTTSYLGLRQLCRQNLAELILRLAHEDRIDSPEWWNHPCLTFSACTAAAER